MKTALVIVSLSAGLLSCASPPAPDALARCPEASRTHADLETEGRPPAADPERGAGLFAAQCSKCHAPRLAERTSRLFHGYPRLDCADYQTVVTDAYLYRVISEGGPSVGLASAMKPFGAELDDQQIADLVAYLRSLTL